MMTQHNNNSLVYLLALIFCVSCKASAPSASSTQQDDEITEGITISSSDVIDVDKKLKTTLESYFKELSSMGISDIEKRDTAISEVIEYFNSPETPVYFVLYNNEGAKYYDKPTNITSYLHYLRDTGQAPHYIQTLRLDKSQTKIIKIELAVK